MSAMALAGLLSLVVGMEGEAVASPLHGCTFYKSRLKAQSWPGGTNTGCANFTVTAGGCQKVKVIFGIPITYRGDLVTGRLPTHFLETTPHLGYSAFTEDLDGVTLKIQLEAAAAYYASVVNLPNVDLPGGAAVQAVEDALNRAIDIVNNTPGAKTGYQHVRDDVPHGYIYARGLTVPYSGLAWNFPSIGVSGPNVFPTCFASLSEFTPHTWADKPGHPETPLLPAASVASMALCYLPTAGVYGPEVVADEWSPWDELTLPLPECAWPATKPQVAIGLAAPGSRAGEIATDPRKACMGRLGPLLPRTGWIHGESEWDSSQIAAYRIATIGTDHFLGGPGIEPGDRWQLVWPPVNPLVSPTAHTCHRPGAVRAAEMQTNGPMQFIPGPPATDGGYRPSGTSSFVVTTDGGTSHVWAVWRRFSRCLEPLGGLLFKADLAVIQAAREGGCAIMNATDGMP